MAIASRALYLAGAVLLSGCADTTSRPDPAPTAVPDHPPTATATDGMVVTGNVYATEAGRRILAAGGNAVDAAVAAAFALAVAEPTQSGLGGRTQMLLRLPDGSVHAVDGTTEVPAAYDPATAPTGEHGHAAVAIPGTVAALVDAHGRFGSLALAAVMEPALAWARDGVVLTGGEAERLAGLAGDLDPASEAARLFTAGGGRPLPAGARLVQTDLAAVLEAVAERGADGFYRGDVAARIAADMAAGGGFVTEADLADYGTEATPTARFHYRGYEIVGSYLPASGVTVGQALAILDRLQPPATEAEWAAVVSEALEAAFEDRETAEAMEAGRAVAWLASDSLADRRAREIARRVSGRGVPDPAAPADDGEAPFTTHVSVADTLGTLAAVTQSLGPTGGARVVTPGLGFLYASTLGGYLTGGGPGYRPWSSQAPLMVMREGRPVFVMGGAGARRILSALVSTLSRVADRGEYVEAALAAPRFHPTGGSILVEEGWAAAEGLRSLGYDVEERDRTYFARLNVVVVGPDGSFLGLGEPRWIGSAAAGPEN